MAWTNIFTKTLDAIVVTVSKAFINHKPEYTIRFEAEKKDEKGAYLSPNLPLDSLGLVEGTMASLLLEARHALALDKDKDAVAEADRVKALSAKPGANLVKAKEKGAPRSTGKTARKRAKLEAARKQVSA